MTYLARLLRQSRSGSAHLVRASAYPIHIDDVRIAEPPSGVFGGAAPPATRPKLSDEGPVVTRSNSIASSPPRHREASARGTASGTDGRSESLTPTRAQRVAATEGSVPGRPMIDEAFSSASHDEPQPEFGSSGALAQIEELVSWVHGESRDQPGARVVEVATRVRDESGGAAMPIDAAASSPTSVEATTQVSISIGTIELTVEGDPSPPAPVPAPRPAEIAFEPRPGGARLARHYVVP